MSDYAISDPEVLAFTEVVDGLTENATGGIGSNDVRAIVKSLIPRYFSIAVEDYPSGGDPLWSGAGELPVVLPDLAPNYRVVGNGFVLDENGAIVYNGNVPLLVQLNFSASFQLIDTNCDITISATHTNVLDNIDEPLFSVETNANENAPLVSVSRTFTVAAGSKIFFTRELESPGTVDDTFSIESWEASLTGTALVPATTEIRAGSYGSQSSAGALFSTLPFTSLYFIPDIDTAVEPEGDGLYAFLVGDSGSNDMAISVSGAWVSTTPNAVYSAIHPALANATGFNGDYYIYLAPGEDPFSGSTPVYGPKADGYWPLYPRLIPIIDLTPPP